MSSFQAVQWNRDKYVYDGILVVAVALYVASYAAIHFPLEQPKKLPDAIDIWIRAFGSCAFLMLTVVLSIGPLARLNPRFLPLLYNRRHFGVLTFFVAATHFWFLLDWYLVQHNLINLVTELTKWGDYAKFMDFPFKTLGLIALLVLFVMAAVSHDFWLAFLTPPIWKALHMAIYVAYGLVVVHVSLGAMQDDDGVLIPIMLVVCFGTVTALHVLAGWREWRRDQGVPVDGEGWIEVGPARSIPDKRAHIVAARGGERIAVFRDGDQIAALSNVCVHQNGPVGEGRVTDGCVTCPWHGFQYRLQDGCSPPPFTEKIATYRVRINRGIVEVDPRALPPGTQAAIRISADAL